MSELRAMCSSGLRATLVVVAVLACPVARAAAPEAPPTVSLADLLRGAAKNPLAAAADREVEAAEADQKAMAGRAFPTVAVTLLAGPTPAAHGDPMHSTTPVDDYGYLLSNLGPFFRAELNLTQPLYTFGKISNGADALARLADVRRAQGAAGRWEVATQIKSAYYALLFVGDLLALSDEVQGYLDQAKKYLEERLKSEDPEVNPVDRAKLAIYESELKAQRVDLEKKRAVLRDALARLAALELPAGWVPAEAELKVVEIGTVDRDQLLKNALLVRPEIQAAAAGVEALDSKRAAVRARWFPDLFLAGRVRYGVAPNRDRQSSPFAKDDFNFLDAGLALGLRYELATGSLDPEVSKVNAEIAALQEKQRALGEKVSHELLSSVDEWRASAGKLEATREGFKSARAWSLFARNGFELGTVAAKELIDALSAFVKARVALLTATYEQDVAVAQLSKAAGRELLPELQAAGAW